MNTDNKKEIPIPACGCTSGEDCNGDCLVPVWVAERILKIRDALVATDIHEAYHWLYAIADPFFDRDSESVWADFEERTGYQKKTSPSLSPLKEVEKEEALTIADYEETLEDHRRLVREIDSILNGDDAAKQASLCDLIGPIAKLQAQLSSANARIAELEKLLREKQEWIDSHF